MKITKIEPIVVHIPLKKDVFVGKAKVAIRDHLLVKVYTDDGYVGIGTTQCYGSARVLSLIVDDLLKPHILGKNPLDIENLWHEMYERNCAVGRRGAIIRAMSAVDIALWDLKCKYANLSLGKFLGLYKEKTPIYTSGGYYREFGEKGLEELREEMLFFTSKNYKAVKMRIGLVPIEEDVARIKVAKEALGEKAVLMLDAEFVWEDTYTAIKSIKAFEKAADIYWIEGPVELQRISMHREIRRAVNTPIATGGQCYTHHEFKHFIDAEAIDIIQADVSVCGGITEWLKIAHMADVYDLKIAPHAHWNEHASLCAAVNNSLFIEYFELERGVKVVDRIIKNPVKPDSEGFISPPSGIGLGFEYDEDKIEEFKVI